MTNQTKQLEPLSKRLTNHQQTKRAFKMEARRSIANELARENAITRGIAITAAQYAQTLHRRLVVATTVLAIVALVLLVLVYVVVR